MTAAQAVVDRVELDLSTSTGPDVRQLRREIAGTAYDTAWLASLPSLGDPNEPRFPTAMQWVVENQLADGSWGGAIRYEHDRIVSTLAALTALISFPSPRRRAAIERGTRYLWQHAHLLPAEPMETVGFELLLPSLVKRARDAGVSVPPCLDALYSSQREEKLKLIPPAFLYSPRTTAVHSLEFLGDQVDAGLLRGAQGLNGAIGNSPAATAFYLLHHPSDPLASAYLRDCLARGGGSSVPVLHPCDTYELLWSAYHLYLAGAPATSLLTVDERGFLMRALRDQQGVSLSPSFPIADADDTAVALLLLHAAGETVDPNVLASFAVGPDGYFASFPHERHSSVGVNLHVLDALAHVPGYEGREQAIEAILEYVEQQQIHGLYWLDKWHISPLYATAHAIRVFERLPATYSARVAPMAERAREWLRHTQNTDGSWGWYDGQATAEETAYGILALAQTRDEADNRRVANAASYLQAWCEGASGDESLPPMWIDKCLYTPVEVVWSVIESAFLTLAVASSVPTLLPIPIARRPLVARAITPGALHV